MDESVIKHLEQQQVGTLKLSAAIRIGAMMHPQGVGSYFYDGKTCAIGAAYFGCGLTGAPRPAMAEEFQSRIPTSIEAERVFTHEVGRSISQANDDGWTREQIADWLEKKGY